MPEVFDISVVIPVYNVEAYVDRCLRSVEAQATPDAPRLQVIVVNDGSTDGSRAVCQRFVDAHPDWLIVDKPNGGLSDARNAGMAVATGRYVYFLDSDDWLAAGALERLHTFAESHGCDAVQGALYYAYDDGRRLLRHVDTHDEALDRQEAMAALMAQDRVKNFAWGKLYRRELIKDLPFRKGAFFEDSFWQHLVIDRCRSYGIVGEPLYYYLQRPASISGAFSARNFDLVVGNLERLEFIAARYPQLVGALSRSIDGLFWGMYPSTRADAAMHARYNELLAQYAASPRRKSLKMTVLRHCRWLYRPTDLALRAATRLAKPKYMWTIPH